jgi:hypothetical protein
MMPETISLFGAITSLLLPWVLGAVWVYWLLRKSGQWNIFLIAGHGYLVGIFLTTVIIRLWSFIGLPIHYWSIAASIGGLAIFGLIAMRSQNGAARVVSDPPPLRLWQTGIIALLLVMILWRYITVTQELYLRPLFPWDAWMNWAPKAITWYHHNELVPFVSRQNWLNAASEALNYTEGAGKAWKYPVTVPVLQLWGMLGLGTSDHTLIYLPWLFVTLALGLALYGHLRLSEVSSPIAVLACYTLLNMPFLNVHVALAGYADIWVAATFGCATFALHQWGNNRHWSYALLSLFLAVMCTQLKIPGLIMGAIIVVILLTSIIKLNTKIWMIILLICALCFIYIAAFGIDLSIEHIGRFQASSDGIELPYIGRYELQYHPIHLAVVDTLFLMINWNMLWYLFILAVLSSVVRGATLTAPSPELLVIVLTLLFIFFVYYFTNRYEFALDFTQINRALLYSIPAIVFYIFHAGFRKQSPILEAR